MIHLCINVLPLHQRISRPEATSKANVEKPRYRSRVKLRNSQHKKRFYVVSCTIAVVAIFLSISAWRDMAPVKQPSSAGLQRLLKYYDAQFDNQQQLLQEQFISSGYHSGIATGAAVHPIRESFYYAVGLLQRGRPEDISRSKAILVQLLPLQQTRPDQPGYGAWSWLLEEPLEKMDSIDLNWADFCGSAIAQILVDHRHQLHDADLEKQMREALRHAATAIRKRNVGAQYTNIAVLGGGVCAVAGEVLEDDDLLRYGRRRLQSVVIHNHKVDSFAE